MVHEADACLAKDGRHVASVAVAVSSAFAVNFIDEDLRVRSAKIDVMVSFTAHRLRDPKVLRMGIPVDEGDGLGVGVEDDMGEVVRHTKPGVIIHAGKEVPRVVDADMGYSA